MIAFTGAQVEALKGALAIYGLSQVKVIAHKSRLRVGGGGRYIVLAQRVRDSFALSIQDSDATVTLRFEWLKDILPRRYPALFDRIDFHLGRASSCRFSALQALVLYLLGRPLSEAVSFSDAQQESR